MLSDVHTNEPGTGMKPLGFNFSLSFSDRKDLEQNTAFFVEKNDALNNVI